MLDEETVGADDVAHVGDIAHRLPSAGRDGRRVLALCVDDAARQRGDDEARGLTRARVREGADAHRLETGAEPGL